ncbi:MAG: GNAT family N-acetyltransferase [Sphingobacteriales bacterium]|nr:MAG: GNAT family N-acetyltransferase [Sphingobacteriales bacterium]
MITLKRYTPEQQPAWDAFIQSAKNGLFLFERAYMDYHSDRFEDHSLMGYNGDELIAVLPANLASDGALWSHQGLTYGGFISGKRMTAGAMLQLFDALKSHCQEIGIHTVYYKAIPYFYHQLPAGEDLYALFRNDAVLYRRDASSLIYTGTNPGYGKGTKASLSKGRKAGLQVTVSEDYDAFMEIEEVILRTRHNAKPTHSRAEIRLLADRFPQHIKLYTVHDGNTLLGGTITFITAQVMHTQYIAISEAGRNVGALDTVIDYILREELDNRPYFSFGTSTEDGGRYLNEGLIRNKESFGARTIVLDFYKLTY